MVQTESIVKVDINSLEELRLWLSRNHGNTESVWLVRFKKSVLAKYVDRLDVFGRTALLGMGGRSRAHVWAVENSGELNGDATRMAVAGESAGANLAATPGTIHAASRPRPASPRFAVSVRCPHLLARRSGIV